VNNTISNKEELPAYVNLKELLVEFKVNNGDVILKVNGKVQLSGNNINDFSTECVYDLYLGDTRQKSYTVKITKPDLSNTFKTFTFPEKRMEQYQPVINAETGEISNENVIPSNIDITSLQPEFTISEKNSIVKVNKVVQKSGTARHDFTKPIVYSIEGEDGTSKEYTVTLKQGNEAFLTNPVIVGSYADPTVIRGGKEFYLYVTSGIVRGYRSTDLINWPRIGGSKSEVFNKRPDFTDDNVNDTGMWAPDINFYDGKYVMYYAISKWGGGATCGIGVGVSDKPEGPFVPPAGNSDGKLFVSAEIGVHNSIDPCFIEENGKRY
jgi:GH43 family beta-xylosidase